MKDKTNIEIKIGKEHLKLTVDFDQQLRVRDTEHAIARLYDTWRKRFPQRSEPQLLAMIAYQYASFYAELRDRDKQAEIDINDCLEALEDIIN